MNEVKIFTKCCKPLSGGKCSKVLRDVLPWMKMKNSSLNLNQKICDSCRKKLSASNAMQCNVEELTDLHDSVANTDREDSVGDNNFESEDENSNAKRMKHDPPYILKETAISLLNNFLAEVGEPPVDTKRLMQKNYCQAKVSGISDILKSTIFRGHPPDSELSEDSGKVVLDQLKEKFRSSSQRSEKTIILTLSPPKWSILKTKSEFEGTFLYILFLYVFVLMLSTVLSVPYREYRRLSTYHRYLFKKFN